MTDATVQEVEETPSAVPDVPDVRTSGSDLAAQYGLRSTADRPPLVEYSRQLWGYRHFIVTFANAKHAATLSGARLGRFWHVLTPLVNAAVYFAVFGLLLNQRDGIDNFVGFLCVGIFLFTFTQTVALAGVSSISSNMGLIRALKFPRASIPIAITFTQINQLLYSVLVLVGIIALTGETFSLRWFLIVPALVLQAIFNAGLALAMARLGSRTSDLKQLVPFAMRTWMYGSGVFYSVSKFSEHLPPLVTALLQINPLLVYIELARIALLESPAATASQLQHWLVGAIWALVVGLGGYVFFWRAEQEYGRG